jgi:hypothetical protein
MGSRQYILRFAGLVVVATAFIVCSLFSKATIPAAASCQTRKDARPSLKYRLSESPVRNVRNIFEDETYLFVARHYGDHRDPGGNTEPGLFVCSKKLNQWIQVLSISTADGRFGTSTSDDPEQQRRLSLSQVVWDFRKLAASDYAEQPLRTSGSIVFPDEISYDLATGRYRLRYLSSWKIPTAETVLYILRADLIQAFRR